MKDISNFKNADRVKLYLGPELVDFSSLSKKEVEKLLLAKKEFLEGKTFTFEEVYKECMK